MREMEESPNVVRVWSGRARRDDAARYVSHFARDVLTSLRSTNGFQHARLLYREVDAETEFLVLTRWDSLDVVREFAGADLDLAVVADEAREALTSFDTLVRHYGVALSADRDAD